MRPHLANLGETAALETLGPRARESAFFRLWTLKEAYPKARGEGLSVPLDTLAVPLHATTLVDADGVQWSLVPVDAGLGWAAAVAVEGAGDLRLHCSHWPPRLDEAVALVDTPTDLYSER